MDIRVRSVTGRTYPLSVSGDVSASTLAQEISLLTGTPSNQLQLFSSGLLGEDTPLHISTGDEVQFLVKARAGVLIYIKTFQGKDLTIEVDLDFDTVAVVKHKIEDKTGWSQDQMILVFNSIQLEDDKNLRSCNLNREDTIHLVAKGDEKAALKQAATNPDGNDNPNTSFWSKCCLI